MYSANQPEQRGPLPFDEPTMFQPPWQRDAMLRPSPHRGADDMSTTNGKMLLTTIECNPLDACTLAQIEQDRPVHVEAVCRQIEAALDGTTLIVRSTHIDKEQIVRAYVFKDLLACDDGCCCFRRGEGSVPRFRVVCHCGVFLHQGSLHLGQIIDGRKIAGTGEIAGL